MPAHRFVPLRKRVTIVHDGDRIEADEGEPVAMSLIAADRIALARSPKLHRPRGPYCLRAGCDGCLSRVDGVPNVMTCTIPAREGMRIETQNVVGTRTVDLLRVTDWFFPHGVDHHHFLAGVPGVSPILQTIARRVAGLGILPDLPKPKASGERREVDTLIIGTGPFGIAAASKAKNAGSTVLVDDGLALGGGALAFGEDAVTSLLQRHPIGGVEVLLRSVAIGVFDRDVVVASIGKVIVFRPARLVLATGAHDGVALFDGNDVPGVVSARAAALLAARGIAIGERIVVAGDGAFSQGFCRAIGDRARITRVAIENLVRVEGASRVGAVVVRDGETQKKIRADALVVEVARAPSFELAAQAGAIPLWDGERGFVAKERLPEGVSIVGEAAGQAFTLTPA